MSEPRPNAPETIDHFLQRLREELCESDPALVQDVLFDAEDHLRAESAVLPENEREEGLAEIIARYGSPQEIADAYRGLEGDRPATLPTPRPAPERSSLQRFFGVAADPRAYSAYFFMLFSLVTGVFFFSWAATGLALSLGLSLLIIGLPFFLFFLASVRALAFVEGRLVEAMLGERMPRRPVPAKVEGNIFRRSLHWISDPRTWSAIAYLGIKLPIGIITFTFFVTLTALSLGFLLYPLLQAIYPSPLIQTPSLRYFVPLSGQFAMSILGVLGLFVTLHLARLAGTIQAWIAKSMLVSSNPFAPVTGADTSASTRLCHEHE